MAPYTARICLTEQAEMSSSNTLAGKELPLMVRIEDPQLESTSSAIAVWSRLLQLIKATYEYVRARQQMESASRGSAV